MPYVNDMQTLADVVSPVDAANQAGIQNQYANQEEAAKAQVAQATVPAEIQKPYLANLFTGAQTAAEQGVAQQQQARGLVGMMSAPTEGQAAIMGNQLKMTQDQAAKMGTLGQMAGQVAAYMDQVPPAARPAAMQQIAQQNNLDLRQFPGLESGDPDLLRNISQKMIQASSTYQTGLMQESVRGQTARDVAQIGSNARMQVAETTANSRIQVQNLKNQIDQQRQSVDQEIAMLSKKVAAGTASPGEVAELQKQQKFALALRDMQAQTTRALLGMGDYSSLYAPGGGGQAPSAAIPSEATGTPTPAPTQAPPSDDKYEYRIGPNGKLQRRAKGG